MLWDIRYEAGSIIFLNEVVYQLEKSLFNKGNKYFVIKFCVLK